MLPVARNASDGLYAHETGVWDNSARYGGWSHFVRWEPFTIAVRLHEAGYTTAFLGKYVNGYGVESNPPVPPGWDRWFAFAPSGAANYFDYTLNVDGTSSDAVTNRRTTRPTFSPERPSASSEAPTGRSSW